MKKYRKKPVIINAMQFDGENGLDVIRWFGPFGKIQTGVEGTKLTISTLEGEMTAAVGDWIIQDIAGELYPCKPGIFKECYEEISDE